jgi:hypothetical protein
MATLQDIFALRDERGTERLRRRKKIMRRNMAFDIGLEIGLGEAGHDPPAPIAPPGDGTAGQAIGLLLALTKAA